MLFEIIVKALALVVESLVDTELLLEPVAFLFRTCDGDDLRAGPLAQLASNRPCRAGGTRDD